MRRTAPSLFLSLAALAAMATGTSSARAAEPPASGAATFAFAYGGAPWVGATSTRSSDRPRLVPFVGPWLALATRGACGGESGRDCGPETTYAGLAIADGLVQAAGVVQIALAFVHGDLRYAKDPAVSPSRASRSTRVSLTPTRTPRGLGLAAFRSLLSGAGTRRPTIEERNAT
jgi:hypothetical protein